MKQIDKEELSIKISQLVRYAIDNLELEDVDALYAYNQLIDFFGITDPKDIPYDFDGDLYKDILTPLSDYALANEMIDRFGVERFKTRIMGFVLPSPSRVIDYFDRITANDGIREATNWFYRFAVNSTYLNEPLLNTNLQWRYAGDRGELVINVNCARPEKDPKEIALAKAMPQTNYPKCMLCKENLGYAGRINHPARQTLRVIPVKLDDDSTWFMQFSPYRYFDQHCIMFSENHTPMTLGEKSFKRMLELVKNFPHYFVGSNAPLPIVGGSILSHDHYQGGSKVMTEFKGSVIKQFVHPDFPAVKISIVDWYNSVLRIKTKDEEQFIKAISFINDRWANYTDEQCNIISHTDDTPHNAITPVIHLERGECLAELFLRNNRTDDEHPYGIFHPTEDLHFIKKEGIGVIEVMGTFILPGRLAGIFQQIRDIVNGKCKFDEKALFDPTNPLHPYRFLIVKLLTTVDVSNPLNVEKEMQDFVSDICVKVIKSTAVFKDDANGVAGFERFLYSIGCNLASYDASYESEKQKAKVYRLNTKPTTKYNKTENKKNETAEASDPQIVENAQPETEPKRKRGRPRKNTTV